MRHIAIWAYDGILASGVAGPIDVFAAANRIWADRNRGERTGSPLFAWRVESPDGKPVKSASGQMVNVDGPLGTRRTADAVIVPGPFVADVARFLSTLDGLAPLLAGLRRQHERGALIASYCS